MDPMLARRYLACLRMSLGAAWVMPRVGGRLFGLDASTEGATFLIRLYAVRDAALGAAQLQARGADADRMVELGIMVDAADLAAIVLAASRRQIRTRTVVLGGGAAAAALALGLRSRVAGA